MRSNLHSIQSCDNYTGSAVNVEGLAVDLGRCQHYLPLARPCPARRGLLILVKLTGPGAAQRCVLAARRAVSVPHSRSQSQPVTHIHDRAKL